MSKYSRANLYKLSKYSGGFNSKVKGLVVFAENLITINYRLLSVSGESMGVIILLKYW